MSSAGNICKQSGPRSGPTKRWAITRSKLSDAFYGIPEKYLKKEMKNKKKIKTRKHTFKQQQGTHGRQQNVVKISKHKKS